jgi:hypothetical protein
VPMKRKNLPHFYSILLKFSIYLFVWVVWF